MNRSDRPTGTLKPLPRTAIWVLRIAAGLLVVGSIASTTDLDQWWIRIWDFPRLQILFALMAAAVLLWLFDRAAWPWLPILLALASAWQFYRVFPYTPLASTEVALAEASGTSQDRCFTLMTFNVLQKNRDYASTIAMIEREDPDILLLLETDEKWQAALETTLARYSNRADRPIDNTYGLMFATRFPMADTTIQDLTEADTPSIYTTLTIAGQNVRAIGIHPRPPHPGQDTDERDAELVVAGKHAKEQAIPVLVFGDFNDVAWSDTSELFKRTAELLDPRIGRGAYATFPSNMLWLGWPLDHLFVSEDFLLGDKRVLEDVGSDHRAVIASLCLDPSLADVLNEEAEKADSDDVEEAAETMQEFREDEVEDKQSAE